MKLPSLALSLALFSIACWATVAIVRVYSAKPAPVLLMTDIIRTDDGSVQSIHNCAPIVSIKDNAQIIMNGVQVHNDAEARAALGMPPCGDGDVTARATSP
jgi:hypothetical protein